MKVHPVTTAEIMRLLKEPRQTLVTAGAEIVNALSGPGGFSAILANFSPGQTALELAFDAYGGQVGIRKADTLALNEKIEALRNEAYGWAYDVEAVYKKGTPQYVSLFPKGRTVFGIGKLSERLAAVRQLSHGLTGITALAPVKTAVDAFLAALNTANNAQKQSKAMVLNKKSALEELAVNCVQGMLSVHGALQQEFNNNLIKVNEYFPMYIMQPSAQTVYMGTLAPDSLYKIAKRTFKTGEFVTLKNTGTVAVQYYMAATKAGALPEGAVPVIIGPGVTAKVAVEQLGLFTNKYLIVRNTTIAEANWEVVLPV